MHKYSIDIDFILRGVVRSAGHMRFNWDRKWFWFNDSILSIFYEDIK